jgi:hypothetical protein
MLSFQISKRLVKNFFPLAICLFATLSNAQQNQTSGVAIGPFSTAFNVFSGDGGWSRSAKAESKAQEILTGDGVAMNPSLAYESTGGGVVFATWKLFATGTGFAAEELTAPRFPSTWKIDEKSVKNTLETSSGEEPFRLRYSAFRAVGVGDGFSFGTGSNKDTFGYWVDMPITYIDGNGFQSGLFSFYYRAAASSRNEDGVSFVKALINSLRLQDGIKPITLTEYNRHIESTRARSSNENLPASSTLVKKPDLIMETVNARQGKSTAFQSSNEVATEAVTTQYSIKASSFCFENGEIKLPPCAVGIRNTSVINSSGARMPALQPLRKN